jgi:hypothetical protein
MYLCGSQVRRKRMDGRGRGREVTFVSLQTGSKKFSTKSIEEVLLHLSSPPLTLYSKIQEWDK